MLVWGEQGVGDEIMFASMITMLNQRTDQVIVESDERLIPLFRRSVTGIEFIARENPANERLLDKNIDYQIPMGSLGQWLWKDEDDFPSEGTFLVSCPVRTLLLRTKYKELADGKLLVGISWKSANRYFGNAKSTSLTYWQNFLSKFQKDCFFINLQYGDVKHEIDQFIQQTGIQVYFDDEIDSLVDLDDFAAQVMALDLVISTSSTTVHMAGALGKPVWTLLHYVPDWRWMMEGEDTLWYPTMRLFRQTETIDWAGVLQKVGNTLEEHCNESDLPR